MDEERICPGCQKPLPPGVPLGLCPACLIQAGFKTGSESGGEGAGFIPPPVEQIAKLFPQLEIIGLIGKGGMGAVYKARQAGLDRLVALKILPPRVAGGPGFAERFNREARALAKLTHPNIVAVHEFGQAGELHYLVMEYVDGANLREVERAGRLAPEQALAIVPQICEALQFAHNEGIVHRDIKPENILLDKKGRVKITDFGIAKMVRQTAGKASLTGAKDVVGTPHYMAPEQIEHAALVDHRADIFSLGVVFYEMLTGELPLGKFQPPSQKVQMDVRLDEVVLHALEKEPDRRFQQVSEIKTRVETIATTPGGGGGASAPSESQGAPAPSLIRLPATRFSKIIELAAEIFFNLMVLAAGGFLSYWMLRVPLDYLGHPESKAPLYFSLCMIFFGAVSAVDQFFRLRKANLTLHEVFVRSMEKGMARRFQQGAPAAKERPSTRFSRMINWTAVILIGFLYLLLLLTHLGYPVGGAFLHYYSLGFFIFVMVATVELFFRFRGREFRLYRVLAAAAFVFMLATAIHFNFFKMSPWVKSDYIGRSWFPKGDSIEITMAARSQDRLVVEGHYNLVGADHALLALYIASTNASTNGYGPVDPLQRMRISRGRGDFKLIHPHLTPGLPYVSMGADGSSLAALYFGTKSEALEESKREMAQLAPAQPPAGGGRAMERNLDVLRIRLRQAEAEAERQKTLYNAGMIPLLDFLAAQEKADILKAELDGDEVKAAQVRLEAAQRAWQIVSQQAQAGLVSGSEAAAAQAEVEVREAELKAAQAAAGRATNSGR